MTERGRAVCSSGAILWSVLWSFGLLCGAPTPLPEAFELDPLVVEATRFGAVGVESPTGITVVEGAAVHRGGLQVTLAESLGQVPGVFILNPDNYAQDTRIAIRGFGARADFGIRGIRLYADGLPLTTPDGQGEVDSIDLGSTARIEVVRGPAAALYGAAAGGVIHLVSEEGEGAGYVESRLTLGGTGHAHMQVKMAEGQGSLRSFVSLGYLERDGYRDHSDTRQFRVNGNFVTEPRPGHRLKLLFNHIDFPLQNDPGGLTRAEFAARPSMARDRNVVFDAGESVRQHRLGAIYELAGPNETAWSATLFHTHRIFSNRLPFESGGQVGFTRAFSGGSLLFQKGGDAFRLQLGMEVNAQADARANFDNLSGVRGPLALRQDEGVRAMGAYGFLDLDLPGGSSLHAGLRADEVRFVVTDRYRTDGDDSGRIAFDAVSPFLGWSFPLSAQSVLYANLSKAFETPTTTEFDNPAGAGFNLDLRAQEAVAMEAGWRQRFAVSEAFLDLEAVLFTIDEQNGLVPYELEAFPGREFYRNAARSERHGMEVSATASLGTGWSASAHLTVSDFRYTRYFRDGRDFSGKRLPGIPRSFGSITLRHEAPNGLWGLVEARFVGSFFADDANQTRIDPHAVFDLKWGWRRSLGRWECEPFFAVANLFNQRYAANIRINAAFNRYYEAAPERFFFLGLRLRASGTP